MVLIVVLVAISMVVRLPHVATVMVALLVLGIPAVWIPSAVRRKKREDFLRQARALALPGNLTPEAVEEVTRLRRRLEPLSPELREEVELILQELDADVGHAPLPPAQRQAVMEALGRAGTARGS